MPAAGPPLVWVVEARRQRIPVHEMEDWPCAAYPWGGLVPANPAPAAPGGSASTQPGDFAAGGPDLVPADAGDGTVGNAEDEQSGTATSSSSSAGSSPHVAYV